MASPKVVAASDSQEAFPAADAVGELYPGTATDFSIDSVSSELAKSKELKEQAEWEKQKKRMEEEEGRIKDGANTLKKTIIITGVVVAVVGAVFAITKKLREK